MNVDVVWVDRCLFCVYLDSRAKTQYIYIYMNFQIRKQWILRIFIVKRIKFKYVYKLLKRTKKIAN